MTPATLAELRRLAAADARLKRGERSVSTDEYRRDLTSCGYAPETVAWLTALEQAGRELLMGVCRHSGMRWTGGDSMRCAAC